MKELSLLVHNATGLHARPAKVLANAAKKFKSDILIWNGGKKANANAGCGGNAFDKMTGGFGFFNGAFRLWC
jgi:hypothetical protein